MIRYLPAQLRRGLPVLGKDQNAGNGLIQPVDNPQINRLAAGRKTAAHAGHKARRFHCRLPLSGQISLQLADHIRLRRPGALYGDPRRFKADQDVLIFI